MNDGLNNKEEFWIGILMFPAIVSFLIFPSTQGIPVAVVFVAFGIYGLVIGAISLKGNSRGLVVLGAFTGLVKSLGGIGATYWLDQSPFSLGAPWFGYSVAYLIGLMPGFWLETILQRVFEKQTNVNK